MKPFPTLIMFAAWLAGSSWGQTTAQSCTNLIGTALLTDKQSSTLAAKVNIDIGCASETASVWSHQDDWTSTLTPSSSMTSAGQSNAPISATPPAQTHVVAVGMQQQLLFNPAQVQAFPGDVVVFQFHRLNHSVTESTLDHPCEKLAGGFDSGFGNVNPDDAPGDFVAFDVPDNNPRWFFCAQTQAINHCAAGMVFGLNPGSLMNRFLDNARPKLPLPPGFTGPYGTPTIAVMPSGSGVIGTVSLESSTTGVSNGQPSTYTVQDLSPTPTSDTSSITLTTTVIVPGPVVSVSQALSSTSAESLEIKPFTGAATAVDRILGWTVISSLVLHSLVYLVLA